jgi:hypothetical protein
MARVTQKPTWDRRFLRSLIFGGVEAGELLDDETAERDKSKGELGTIRLAAG